MQTVAIVGVGLIGASFGLALRSAGFSGEIIGVSSPEALKQANLAGAISGEASLEEACRSADVVYLAQTVDRIVETLPKLDSYLHSKVLVTDAGSTKVMIAKTAAECLPAHCFVPGHPLAGKETRGAAAAEASLFRDRPYVLGPVQGPRSPHLAEFRLLLEKMGARIVEMTPEEHDETLAFTSHLPQLVSTALAAMLEEQGNPHFRRLHGPGLVDMTRLALSAPELWSEILRQNRNSIVAALDAFVEQLRETRAAVVADDISKVFVAGQKFAAAMRKPEK